MSGQLNLRQEELFGQAAPALSGRRPLFDVGSGLGNLFVAAGSWLQARLSGAEGSALLEEAWHRAVAEDLEMTFTDSDAKNPLCSDGKSDYVLSAIGAMFVPSHGKMASELLRPCAQTEPWTRSKEGRLLHDSPYAAKLKRRKLKG